LVKSKVPSPTPSHTHNLEEIRNVATKLEIGFKHKVEKQKPSMIHAPAHVLQLSIYKRCIQIRYGKKFSFKVETFPIAQD
jgi:hypothetical protein